MVSSISSSIEGRRLAAAHLAFNAMPAGVALAAARQELLRLFDTVLGLVARVIGFEPTELRRLADNPEEEAISEASG